MTKRDTTDIPFLMNLTVAESDALIALSGRTGRSTIQLAREFVIDGIQRQMGKPIQEVGQ